MNFYNVIAKFRHPNGNIYTVNHRTISAASENEAISSVAQKLQGSSEYVGELQSLVAESDDEFAAECMKDYSQSSRYWTGD